ncbi:hypothetical protein [Aliiroseovarius crassostreae]|uniref:hypothetical protein n=1 Tax=Aliiroseovarius crassostreae TaxID=154981 RepID=UPI0021FB8396|nr:hypothetical protein [Aliiroseovarius crassostreae]UWP88434.1 hypothetical protein K3J57_11080 [Aliiroseovarius crassostreae]
MQPKYAWIDHRWHEDCWLEVFRMRFCGWLPTELATKAIDNGLFHKIHTRDQIYLELSERAHNLTDLAEYVGESDQNCIMLANVLRTKGFEESWLQIRERSQGLFLEESLIFPTNFRKKILNEVASLDRS